MSTPDLDNPFIKPASAYTRDINILRQYINDATWFLYKNTKKPMAECEAFVLQQIAPDGPTPMTDPKVYVLEKDDTLDRHRTSSTFLKHLHTAVQEKAIMSPTLAQYDNPIIHGRSPLATLTINNIKARKVIKKEMFAAQSAGDKVLEGIKNNQQTSVKLENNSMSGAFASPYNPIYLKSGHSTLTSICRCASGYGNSNNERLLSGNRHYWCYDVTIANIVSVIQLSDLTKVATTMAMYDLRAPTYDETLTAIKRSTDRYWWGAAQFARLESFLKTLTDLERAAFLFTGDMWSLAQVNPTFVRTFIAEMGAIEVPLVDNPKAWMDHCGGDLVGLAMLLNEARVDGRGLDEITENDPDTYCQIASTAKHVLVVMNQYRYLIETFWTTPAMPPSLARFPDSIRVAAITSDTDSTIYTVQDWVEWYTGSLAYTATARMVWYVTVCISSLAIIDVLARCCKHMGVVDEDLSRLSMKNEFGFPVFIPTSRAKHYYALQSYREGNVFKTPKLERKGVGLRDSTQPIVLMDNVKKLILYILNETLEGRLLSMERIIGHVSYVENMIRQTLLDGKPEFLRSGNIKEKAAYKQENSKFLFYEMWEAVFSEKYGKTEEPPYPTYQVGLDTAKAAQLKAFFAHGKEVEIIEKLKQWFEVSGKKSLTTLELPKAVIDSVGVPAELIPHINIRQLIANNCYAYYLLLESLSYPMSTKNNARQFGDFYAPVELKDIPLYDEIYHNDVDEDASDDEDDDDE